ncbi:MAG: hypothetical protein KAV87_21170 [Desulfobacteraceae bacterium]|nr:hypothetical protein [Desulfobacteraceae bacterium]
MSWKDTLAAIAPTLATALGGPLAGAATKFLASELLGNENSSIEDIELAITGASPEQLVNIKELDSQFKLGMKKLDIDVFELEVADKGDAREHNRSSNMPAVLSVALTIFIVGIVCALFYTEPPQGAREVLFMLLGVVIKEWSNSMHYWYGTTRSSQDKTRLLK